MHWVLEFVLNTSMYYDNRYFSKLLNRWVSGRLAKQWLSRTAFEEGELFLARMKLSAIGKLPIQERGR